MMVTQEGLHRENREERGRKVGTGGLKKRDGGNKWGRKDINHHVEREGPRWRFL